ncbi:hypothetical protein VTL71DRAFT_811 [Oculimacula yallundae]|uniref:NAD(P)-binding protein n=1 Tax=Oculimacula yallundae TaxID=86028 RepID=A0ABR4D162_9HELO
MLHLSIQPPVTPPRVPLPVKDFNLASSNISRPSNLQLFGRTALVTGGRLNLGYHTALRLLRCGAKVIISTRYPHDTERKHNAEMDSSTWETNLRIDGADFRAASDVFGLVAVMKKQLREWSQDGEARQDVLINNAAQTLTDTLEKEMEATHQEKKLAIQNSHERSRLLLDSSGYEARVGGGVTPLLLLDPRNKNGICGVQPTALWESSDGNVLASSPNIASVISRTPPPANSSWMQTISQIPYEDIISAHSVNTFVPLILVREFLPIMGSPRSSPPTTTSPSSNKTHHTEPSKPSAYIINVSSREGIFESNPSSSSKAGHHVHTNLTKAALNMLTETEAAPGWHSRRAAINSVDPGYMSAAPEIEAR